jgi:hypothetical protein
LNSFVNSASLVRTVHLGLAGRFDALPPWIPHEADLLTFDPDLREFERLIDAAIQATRVLHRKRRGFIPILDNILITHLSMKPSLAAMLSIPHGRHWPGFGLTGIDTATLAA